MGKTNFDGKTTIATGDDVTASQMWNTPWTGIQDEFEERQDDFSVAGVLTSLLASTSTAAIVSIAAGDGYGTGKRYKGGETITFSGTDAAGTWYVYWDASAEALAKSTTSPDTTIDILLCSVVWDGLTTLSSLVDLRPWGVQPQVLVHFSHDSGTVTTGVKTLVPIPYDCWIDAVKIVQSDNGSASATIVDVHAGDSGSTPATIWTTTARRPSIDDAVDNYTVVTSGTPDGSRKLTAGQILTIEVDQAGTGAQTLGVTVYGRFYR